MQYSIRYRRRLKPSTAPVVQIKPAPEKPLVIIETVRPQRATSQSDAR